MLENVGVVAIGRNEGERLRRCLDSLAGRVGTIVYVDSGSTDQSVALARARNAEVVELDTTVPFTAARARNAGFRRLREVDGRAEFVQFVDGDCQVVDGWLETAAKALGADPATAVVCGRRREVQRDASIYNRLCDLEWDTPVGETTACGGDAMMRVDAFSQVRGFDPGIIAGEEPDLCLRLRRQGGRIWRLDADMTLHDAALTRFGQWWKRSVRAGHAFAEGAWRHGRAPERHWVRESRSNWFWGLGVPLVAVAGAWPTWGISLALLLSYPVLAHRIARWCRGRGWSPADARLYGWFCALGKFPQVLGQIKFHFDKLRGRRARLIEYK